MVKVINPPDCPVETAALLKTGMLLSQHLHRLHHPAFANGRASVAGQRYEGILAQILGVKLIPRSPSADLEALGRIHEVKLGEFRAKVLPVADVVLNESESDWPVWWYLARDKTDACRIDSITLFTTRALIEYVGLTEEKAHDELRLAAGYRRRRPALWELTPSDARQMAQMVVSN
jgi:hypothetical protein